MTPNTAPRLHVVCEYGRQNQGKTTVPILLHEFVDRASAVEADVVNTEYQEVHWFDRALVVVDTGIRSLRRMRSAVAWNINNL